MMIDQVMQKVIKDFQDLLKKSEYDKGTWNIVYNKISTNVSWAIAALGIIHQRARLRMIEQVIVPGCQLILKLKPDKQEELCHRLDQVIKEFEQESEQ